MRKVVFCNITWMKEYCGVTDYDRPMNGGKYIKENGDGGEVYNFSSYNHKLYGFVMHRGNELHIERCDKVSKNSSEIDDVTVVWFASDGDASKIVGWYEHATMYRYWQSLSYSFFFGGSWQHDYNFSANEEDCYLIDEKDRTFIIPRASKAGKGRGMGQSHVWYADSEYAQNEFIPRVLEYLESMKGKTKLFFWYRDEISRCAEDNGMTVKELMDRGVELFDEGGHFDEAIALINLAVKKDDCFDTRLLRAQLLSKMAMYDEAEEDYKQALYYKDAINVISEMMYVEMMMNHIFLAIELGEKIRSRKRENENWPADAEILAYLYYDEGKYNSVKDLIKECRAEEGSERHEWIEDFEKENNICGK